MPPNGPGATAARPAPAPWIIRWSPRAWSATANRIRLAIAGAHPYPVRSDAADAALSAAKGPDDEPAIQAAAEAFGPPRADSRASAEYRAALLQNMIRASLEELA